MQLSVVVPSLNGREELSGCLDALATAAPDAEVVVVNGPSADGTTGMVRERDDVDVLVEVADRTLNAARNAGVDHATGDAVAFVSRNLSVERGWRDAVEAGLLEADVATGPTRPAAAGGDAREESERHTYRGREVVSINPYNVAFDRAVLDELDGFDEYIAVGDGSDVAHRVAGAGRDVSWQADMATRPEVGTDGGVESPSWHWKYRAEAYTLVKNYGPRPTLLARLAGGALRSGAGGLSGVVRGDGTPSRWLGGTRDVFTGITTGTKDGLAARRRDVAPRRNPNGRSMRTDRAVSVYEFD